MRHRRVTRRLGRDIEHHWAILRNQVVDLIKHGRITTTLAKAKELRRLADKVITLAKKGDLSSRRRALALIRDKVVVRKLFTEIRTRYLDRPGGYTRIIRIGPRRGDASMMVMVELVEEKVSTRPSKVKKDRLKKVLEFIEKKKKEYGLVKEEAPKEVLETSNKESKNGSIQTPEQAMERGEPSGEIKS